MKKIFTHTLLLIVSLLLVSCMSKTPEHRFFLLSATATPQTAENGAEPLAVSISTVTLPEYLNQKEMVLRLPSGELKKTGVFWGQDFKEDIRTVVTENLGVLLGTDKAIVKGDSKPVRLRLKFHEFAEVGQGKLVMRGVCVCEIAGEFRQFSFSGSRICKETPESRVQAHNQLLADLSVQIADFLRK
ncbi:MAG: membrane integrity-associated transporter subunit PqiC [Victivallales bacterium]|nr:membrane integrity-associated transporter subunit PqiC [Victivallales bacterium]